jgi:hypothetical protein
MAGSLKKSRGHQLFNSIDGTAFVDGIADCWPTPEIKAVCRTGASQI